MSETRFTLPSAMLHCGVLALAAGGLVCAAHAQERGRLLDVQAGGDSRSSFIQLLGDRPLSFTTLKLSGPPRIVVDFADTELSGAPEQVVVDDGTIRRVATAAAGSRTARVVIELAADAEFDVKAEGSRVEVRVPRRAPLLAKAEPPPAAQQPARNVNANQNAKANPNQNPPKPTADAQKRASLPTVALVGSKPRPDDTARRAAAAEKAARLATERAAAAEKGARLATERAAARKAAADRAREQRLARAARPKPQRKIAKADSPRRAITGIGFRPTAGGEVIVRSDQPLEYGISGEDNAVLLHLPSAGIALPNNRRPLDTRFFDGPVQRIVPLNVPGGTDVRIELRRHAEYHLAQSGSVLTVTFTVPRP